MDAEREIERINGYSDSRFSQKALLQHGAFLIDGQPYEVEVTGPCSALVRGPDREAYPELIELFRFYGEHICRFYGEEGELLAEYPPVELFRLRLDCLQPSQFFVDIDKLEAVKSFVRAPEDIAVPVQRYEDRFISQDGHTRLAAAVELGFEYVLAFETQANDYILGFVAEAIRRGVSSPYDLPVIPHEEYEIKWNQFCDGFFERNKET